MLLGAASEQRGEVGGVLMRMHQHIYTTGVFFFFLKYQSAERKADCLTRLSHNH